MAAAPDPPGRDDGRLSELEARVRLLEDENAALAEGREDAILLGLITEQIQGEAEPGRILHAGLERISVLKDVPLSLCLSLRGTEAAVVQHYASFTDAEPSPGRLSLPPRLLERLAEGSQILDAEACVEAGLGPGALLPFTATAALLVPFRARAIPDGLFVFADDRGPERLERKLAFLHRLCEALATRLDNVALLGELRDQAASLELKVRERTQDLAEQNLALTREIGERRHAEAALRESEEKFRHAFKTSPDSININRLEDGAYLAINDGFTRITGWTEADVLGRSSLELDIWDDPADRARLVEALKAHGAMENLLARFRFKDGRVVEALMSARLLFVGGEACVLSVTRDVTALKDAQAERDRLAVQLGEAQKMEAVGRLAGGVAHDFNNLLTVILSCAEALRRDMAAGAPALPDDVEQIRAAGERARDLTSQLLAFARRQVIAPVPLDLNAVVKRSERLLRRVIGEDVELVVEAAPGLRRVVADPGQVEQVLLNLAVNARDAMPGGGTLTIRTRNAESHADEAEPGPHARAGPWVRLQVSDSGTGMTPEVLAHVFEPFFTTKPDGQGTGLGLAMVHGIVAQSGGHVHVESEPGKGATFEIWLPTTPGDPDPADPAAPPGDRVPISGTETVLVVEDDAPVRRVTARALEEAGYRVLVAGSGGEALELAGRGPGPVDLLVTDVVMPGLGGRAVAEKVRARHPGVRVLFVSGYPQEAIAHQGRLDPGIVFLPKPFTPATLLARVRSLLDEG